MKKVLALTLAVVLAFGMATVGFAKIDGIDESYFENTTRPWGLSDSNDDWEDLEIAPQDEYVLKFILLPGMFTDGNGNPADITTAKLSNGNIGVSAKKTKGYPTLDSVKIKSDKKTVYIEVKFIKELVNTSSVDFEYDVTLTYKKSKKNFTTITIAGTMENPIINVDEDSDTVDLSDGSVAEAEDFVKDIEVEAGNGVYVTMNMFEDGKYYCKATMDVTTADATVLDNNPEIDSVITMKTATSNNVSFRSAKVTFDMPDRYYVYNADGQYIGVSTDSLPFSSKYYLASTRIELGDDELTDDGNGDGASYVEPPVTGGDDGAPNANDNPSTGVNGFVNVAVVAGVVALAAAGAVSLKK